MSTSEASHLLRVSPETVRSYVRDGRLRALRTATGRWRLLRDDVRVLGGLAPTPRGEGGSG
jgi:excisionase family DNA binding protein